MLDWKPAKESPPGMTVFANDDGAFAGVAERGGEHSGWLMFAKVADVDQATTRAVELGAEVLEAKKDGPGGSYSIITDPGGAAIALWQRA